MKPKQKRKLYKQLHNMCESAITEGMACVTARFAMHHHMTCCDANMSIHEVEAVANYIEILLEEFYADERLTPPHWGVPA